jgi:arylformamidase
MMMKIYDISLPIVPSMPLWPGDPSVDLRQVSAISSGDTANVSWIGMGVHTGTHLDAPKHFLESGLTIEQIPINKMIGKVLVLEIDIAEDVISEQVLKSHPKRTILEHSTKVLFRTRNSNFWEEGITDFRQDYVGIDTSGARFLSNLKLDLVGIDYLSVAPFAETRPPHLALLSENIILLEGIDLSQVPEGEYDLFCLPLLIPGCEGSPARAILIDTNRKS